LSHNTPEPPKKGVRVRIGNSIAGAGNDQLIGKNPPSPSSTSTIPNRQQLTTDSTEESLTAGLI